MHSGKNKAFKKDDKINVVQLIIHVYCYLCLKIILPLILKNVYLEGRPFAFFSSSHLKCT